MTHEPVKQKPTAAPATTTKPKQPASDMDMFLALTREMAVAKRQQGPAKGRLIFAVDATASRQPTWDKAAELQNEMFCEARNLAVQLVFYRGTECKHTSWHESGDKLGGLMRKVMCQAGQTQIGKVLVHCLEEAKKGKVDAAILVGDAFEENLDLLAATAAELGNNGVKVFCFQEGDNKETEIAFQQIARLTHGGYCHFDAGAPRHLAKLLRWVAAYACGGLKALAAKSASTQMLTFFETEA
jgi:hypothetical protein